MTMNDRLERPARGKLAPASNDVDPIDVVTPKAAPAPETTTQGSTAPSPTRAAQPNATVQSGVSWSLEIDQIIRDAKEHLPKKPSTRGGEIVSLFGLNDSAFTTEPQLHTFGEVEEDEQPDEESKI